ncbi:MAG: hypothetical protein FWD66_10725 [Paludibacter sp.]|nr:hypothetical protein [Paludibacter sp.]
MTFICVNIFCKLYNLCGLEKGKIEGIKEVAKSLSKMGVPLAKIIKATSLSEIEINQILT